MVQLITHILLVLIVFACSILVYLFKKRLIDLWGIVLIFISAIFLDILAVFSNGIVQGMVIISLVTTLLFAISWIGIIIAETGILTGVLAGKTTGLWGLINRIKNAEILKRIDFKKFNLFRVNRVNGLYLENQISSINQYSGEFAISEELKKIDAEKSDLFKANDVNGSNPENQKISNKDEFSGEFTVNEEELSYVDFENKNDNYEDVFSKYIRGEIDKDDVSKIIVNKHETKGNAAESKKQKEVEEDKSSIKEQDEANTTVQENKTNTKQKNKADIKQKNKAKKIQNNKTEIIQKNETVINELPKEDISKKQDEQNDAVIEGIETEQPENTEKTIEQLVDSAFEFKKKGLLMEAIECYTEVLSKNPDEQLILWVVIEICTLYKQAGQESLAKEMVESYLEILGDSFSEQTKQEIIESLEF